MTSLRAATRAIACVGLAAACAPFGEAGATASSSSGDRPPSDLFSSPDSPGADGGTEKGPPGSLCVDAPPRCGGQIRVYRSGGTGPPPGLGHDGTDGRVQLLEGDGFCAPHAMRAESYDSPGASSYLRLPFEGVVTAVHVRFAVRGPDHEMSRGVKFGCGVVLSTGTRTAIAVFDMTGNGEFELDGDVQTTDGSNPNDPDGVAVATRPDSKAWRVAELSAKVDASGTMVTDGTFDGKSAKGLVLELAGAPSGGEVRCGVLDANGPYTVDIDDVQVEVCGGAVFVNP